MSELENNTNNSFFFNGNGQATETHVQIIKKLTFQNEKLRLQLKELSERLDATLDKQKYKKPTFSNRPNEISPSNAENIRGELENAYKQIEFYKKELKFKQIKMEDSELLERITNLENLSKSKDMEIEKLKQEIKTLKKIQRDHEKILEKNGNSEENEYVKKMNSLFEENMFIKRKMAEIQNKNRMEEKKQMKQQEYLVQLETRYREINEKVRTGSVNPVSKQRSNNLSFNGTPGFEDPSPQKKLPVLKKRPDSTAHYDKQKQTNSPFYNPKVEGEGEEKSKEISEENVIELQRRINVLQKSKNAADRKSKMEIEKLTNQIREMEKDIASMSSLIREKEKEANILRSRYNELRRQIKGVSIKQLEKELEDNAHPNQEKNYVPEKIKFDERGKLQEKGEKFSDRSILGDLYTIKLNKIKVWSDDNCIRGIQAWYMNYVTREIIEAPIHCSQGSNFTISNFDLPLNDYIRTIGGALGNTGLIETLYVVSTNGKTGRFGKEKKGQKHFELDISPEQIPISITGAVVSNFEGKSEDGSELGGLCMIGAEIIRDEVLENIEYEKEGGV